MSTIAEKWNAFCEWQQQPYQVTEKSQEHHRCRTCGEEFQGNYCPRCGQSSSIGRYSIKNTLMQFIEVWGVGDRSVFRTMRDLLLRPGYMIRDYISGMQMAYFPPFKLLFLLTALQLIVSSGFNLEDKNFWGTATEQTVKASDDPTNNEEEIAPTKLESKDKNFATAGYWLGEQWNTFSEKYPNINRLLLLSAMSIFLFFLIRRSPNIPQMRFSELLAAQVYIWNMISIYDIVISFFTDPGNYSYFLYLLLPIIPLKQLTGFSWWRTILLVVLSYFFAVVGMFIAVFTTGVLIFGALD